MSKQFSISRQVFFQGLIQLLSIPYIYISHWISLPNKSNYRSKVEYQLPFEGEWTVINGGTEKEFSHSWGVPTQRYAYDFVIMDNDGKTYQGERADKHSYYCYSKNILAPADGVVVAIGNKCADSTPFGDEKVELNAKDIRGNYILIKHAEKEYGFIGHIKPESIQVEVGQTVHKGEVIAKCGNTGNTSEPHIHFHLQDEVGFFTSAGLPILFQDINVLKQDGYLNYDNRPVLDTIMPTENGQHINRGQRVINRNDDCDFHTA